MTSKRKRDKRDKPTLQELDAARRLLNQHAPNLYGQLPATILRYYPGVTQAWLDAADKADVNPED